MNLAQHVARELDRMRTSPGPGFEQQAAAAGMQRAARTQRRRLLASGGLGAIVVAAGALLLTAGLGQTETPAPARTAERPQPAPQRPAGGGSNPAAADLALRDLPELAELTAAIDMTNAQVDAVRTAVDDGNKQQVKLRAEIDTVEIDLRSELARAEPDGAKVEQMVERVGALEAKARLARIRAWLKIRSALTRKQVVAVAAARPRERDRPARKKPRQIRGECDEVACLVDPLQDCCATKTGTLQIAATPYARVTIDGKDVGVTPLTVTLKPGRHVVRLRARDVGPTVDKRVVIKAGVSVKLAHRFPTDPTDPLDGL